MDLIEWIRNSAKSRRKSKRRRQHVDTNLRPAAQFRMEPMEPRLLLDATPFVFDAAQDALNLTLALNDVSGVRTLQLSDNSTDTVVASRALADASEVVVSGSGQNDVLTIAFADDSLLNSIPIHFDGGSGDDALLIADGSFDTATYFALGPDSGTITLGSGPVTSISYIGVETVVDITSTANRLFVNDTNAPQDIRIGDDGEINGLNIIDSNDTGGFTTILFDQPADGLAIHGGQAGDHFFVGEFENAFAFNVLIEGGAGADTLTGPGVDSLWEISGPDSGRLNTGIEFSGIENLTGSEDTDDTFVFDTGGTLTGQVDGGAGGVDTLIIRNAADTVVVVPDESGTAASDSRTFSYAGLEPFVDTSDPATTLINATIYADDLKLESDSDTPGNLRIHANNFSFLNAGFITNFLSFEAPSDRVVIDLRDGDDALTLGSIEPALVPRISIAGGIGHDRVVAPDSTNTWLISAEDGGTLNDAIDFAGIENIDGGTGADTFEISPDGSITGTLDGGGGIDSLSRQGASIWTVRETDSGDIKDATASGTIALFHNIANLLGNSEYDDTFVLDLGGILTGRADGGVGAIDQLLIIGAAATVLVLPDASGIAMFDGRTVAYAGLEPVVNASDTANVEIRAMVFDDNLLLKGDDLHPADSSKVELTGSSYKFLSGGSILDALQFTTAGQIAVYLRQGDDVLALGSFNPGFASAASIDGGEGADEIIGPGNFNSWRLDSADGGLLDSRFQFNSFENIRGGSDRDIFIVTADGSLSGTLHGGGGNDDLLGPSGEIAWNVTADNTGELTDQQTGGTIILFFGIENLRGAEDNVDSFIISVDGSLSGTIEGGDGGWDSLVVRGTHDTVVVPGLLFGNTFFDTATINGVEVTYKGLEPFVDTANASDVTINGTGVNDDLTLAADPDDAGNMRITGNSGLLFYTNSTFSDGINFETPAIGLTINLRFGDDTLTIAGFNPGFNVPVTITGGFGMDAVTISADLFLSGQNLTIHAESIHVSEDVIVSTRQVGGSQDPLDHLNGESTGASGNITFNAESSGLLFRALASTLFPALSEPTGITIAAGAALLADVDESHRNEFTAGDITLIARDENGLGLAGSILTGSGSLPLSGVFSNRAEIVLEEGAILRGADLTINAAAKFSPHPDFLDQKIFDTLPYKFQPDGTTKLGELLGKIPVTVGTIVSAGSKPLSTYLVKKVTGADSLPLQILGKTADAAIDVQSGTEITGSGHVTIESDAIADATTKVDNPKFSVAFSLAHATSEVLIEDGSHIRAGGNVNVVANASATAKSEASTTKNKTKNPNIAENLSAKTFSVAISESQTTAHSTLSEGAHIEAGGDVNIVANGISTNEAGAKFEIFLDGTFGISLGIGFATSDIQAKVAGSILSEAVLAHSIPPSGADGETGGGVDADKDTIDLGVDHGFFTGQAVVFHQDPEVTIDKLTDGTTYYVIAQPGSTRIKLAADLTGALQGKAIDLSSPADPAAQARFEAAAKGISVTANLASGDKASAEAGIGDAPKTLVQDTLANLSGKETVKKLTGKLPFGLLEKQRDKLQNAGVTASGASSKPSDYSIAGAIAFSHATHDVTANVAGSAVIKSRSGIQIQAFLTEKAQTAAESSIDAEKSANAKKKKSGSVALIIGIYDNAAHARISDGAAIDASGTLSVESKVLYPFLTEPTELFSKEDLSPENLKKLFDGKLGIQDKLLNSWAVSSANADELAISGSINWLDFTNVSEAIIGEGALINQDVLYQSNTQSVSLTATTEMQLVNMTGVFDLDIDLTKLKDLFTKGDKLAKKLADLNPLGPGFESDGKGFGGSLFVLLVDNHTTARVSANALIHTGADGELLVHSESKMLDISMVQSGGSGGKFGAAGSFSVIRDDGATWAEIQSGAQIHGGKVTLEAVDETAHVNVVGGYMKGEARGVGVSAAINLVGRDTAAFIGNEAGLDPGAGGTTIESSGDIALQATGTGNLFAVSLAAAIESNKPMKGDSEDPLDGVSLPILFGDAEPEKEPSKTGLGIAGSVSWNTVKDQTRAYIHDNGTITGDDIELTAHNDRGIISVSGAAAILKTKGSDTSTALAGAFSLNQLNIETLAFIDSATLETTQTVDDDTDEITLTAKRDGLLFSFSAGGAGAATKNGTAGTGSVSVNRMVDTTRSSMDGVTVTTGGDVALIATGASQIIAIAGAGSFGDSKGVGGAIALNQIAGSTQAAILGDLRRSVIGTVDSPIGDLTLSASNNNSIQSVALSVGASKGGGLAVTLAINLIITTGPVSGTENSVDASIEKADVIAGGDITLHSLDDSTLEAVGGAVGIGKDKYGFGAALGWNQVNDHVSATIEDATVTTAGFVHLTAEATDNGPLLNGRIAAASVGAAGSKQTAIGGALSINVIHDTIDAHISAGAVVTAIGDVILNSQDDSTIKALSGGIAISTGATAVGVAIGVNDIQNTITSSIDGANVTSSNASVQLGAQSDAKIGAITIGGSGADKFAIGGSVAINLLRNTIDGHVSSNAEVIAFGAILISAADNAEISGLSGGLAFSKSNAIGAALSTNDILDTTKAYIDHAEATSLNGNVDVDANSAASILAITVGGAGAQSFALGGSITVNIIRNQTEAFIANAADVEAHGRVGIHATEERANDNSIDAGFNHGFTTGDAATYDNGGGASIGGLESGETYYVIVDAFDPGKLRLAASKDDALAGVPIDIDPSVATGALHDFRSAISFDPAMAMNEALAENAIDLGPDHGLFTGKAVQYQNGGGHSLGGIEDGATYYVIVDDTDPDNVRLAMTESDALFGIAIDLNPAVTTGTGHSLVKGITFDPARQTSTTRIVGIAGGLAGAGKNAVGAALASNDIANQTKAYIDNATVLSLTGNIELEASSQAHVSALTIGGAGAGTFAAGGAIAVNLILNIIDAHITNSLDTDPGDADITGVHAAGSVLLHAADDSRIDGGAGGIAGAGQNAAGAALMTNDIANDTKAFIEGSTVIADGVQLDAQSGAQIRSIAIGGAGAGSFALGGSLSINIAANTIDAHIAASSDVRSRGDILVSAVDNTTIFAGAGGFAGAGTTAIGAALASNDTANTTTAAISGSTVDSTAGSIELTSDSAVDIRSATVSGGGAGSTNINGSIAVHVTHNNTNAYIGTGAIVSANGNVILTALDDIYMLVGAGNLGGAGSTAIGISSSTIRTSNTTEAYVAAGAIVSALGNQGDAAVLTGERGSAPSAIGGLNDGVMYFAIVDAGDPNRIRLAATADDAAAGIAIDLDPATAAGNSHRLVRPDSSSRVLFNPSTDVDGDEDSVDAGAGHGFATGDAVVYEIPAGENLTENIRGLSAAAVSFERIIAIAAGGQGGGSIGAAGSLTINSLDETTRSYIGAGAQIHSQNGNEGANPGQSVNLLASDETSLFSLAGAGTIGGSAGIGAGVDVGVVTKHTEVHIDDTAVVHALNDVAVRARSLEAVSSLSAALSGGGSAGIGGAASVYAMHLTTIASIGNDGAEGAVVHAGDSVVVSAQDRTELDLIGGSITAGGAASVGASAAVPVIDKITKAFIGTHSTVTGNANGDGIDALSGQFDVTYTPDGIELGEVPSPLFFAKDGITVDVTGDGTPDLNDPQLTQNRISTPQTAGIHGVAVTAVNQDDIELVGASGGGAGAVAVNIGGAVNLITTLTTAFIGEGAHVNPDVLGVGSGQSVLVAAANDYAHTGMALVPAGAETVAVTPGADVSLVDNTTEAFIADGAEVRAAGNIAVVANASEDILSLSAGVAISGLVSVAGALSVITIDNKTTAHIGNHPTGELAGAIALAGGSVLVTAADITGIDLISGSLGVGIGAVGVGASVSYAVVNKDTEAFIGDDAVINAKGNGDAISGVLNGIDDGQIGATGFSTEIAFNGLAVQAASAEDVVSVAAAGAGGFYAGVAGGVSSAVLESATRAFIGAGAQVNPDSTDANVLQSVSVVAANAAKALGITGGLGIGIAGIGGAVDLGVIRNDTAAFVAEGAVVKAENDVDVAALSIKDVDTLAVAAAGGIVGAVGAVSVWTIGSDFVSSYTTDDESHEALTTSNGSTYTNVQHFVDAMAGGKISGSGYTSIIQGFSRPAFNPATAVDNDEETIDLGPNHGLHQGDAVAYENGGGESIGGLQDGERYYVILDADHPNRVRLASSQHEALEGVAIDLDASVATGNPHSLIPYAGSITSSVSATIDGSAPENEVTEATSNAAAPTGTSAYAAANATIEAGGDVHIRAEEQVAYDGRTGSVAIGVAGIGGSITIASIQSHTDAHVASGAAIIAGGPESAIVIEASLAEHTNGSAFAGQAGGVAAGAQVVVINDNSTQMAYIADGAFIENAGSVAVLSGAGRTITANSTGGGIGGVALGAAVAVVHVHGGTTAFADGAIVGRNAADQLDVQPTVGTLVVGADSTILAEAHTIAVVAGLGGGAVNGSVALTTVDPNVTAFIGDDADILVAEDVLIQALLEADVSSEALGIGVDPIFGALGASVAIANFLPAISAYIGGSATVLAGNDIVLRSANNYDRNGNRVKKGARATATSGSGGVLIGGSGAFATVDNSPDVETYAGSGSTLSAGNDVVLIAEANRLVPSRLIDNPANPAQKIEIGGAQASGAGFGALGIGVSVTDLTIGGNTLSHIDGATVSAGHDIAVSSESVADAAAKAWAVSGGIAGGTGNKTTVTVDPDVKTTIGADSVIHAANDVRLISNSEGDVQAEAKGLSVGGVAIGVSLVDARMTPHIDTSIAPGMTATAGGSIFLVSSHNYGADAPMTKGTVATGNSSGGGLLSGNGADVQASASADLNTSIGGGAIVNAGEDVVLATRSHNHAEANGTGAAIGVVGIGAILADAEVTGSANSHIDTGATIIAGRDVAVLAKTVDEGVASAKASGGGLASGNGADARSIVSPTVHAFIGGFVIVDSGRDVHIAAQSETHSTATSLGTTVGGISVGSSFADAETAPVVSAAVGDSSVIQAGHSITVSALYNIADDGTGINTARADATGSAGSLLAGVLAGADAKTVAAVQVLAGIGANARLDITGDLEDTSVTVASNAHNSVQANATGNSDGLFTGDKGASGTRSLATVHTHADAAIADGAAIGGQPALAGNLKNVAISSIATSVVHGSADGASGKDIAGALSNLFSGQISIPSILSGGGTVVDFDIDNLANTEIGADARIKAEGQVSITADGSVDVSADATMTSGGVVHADSAVLADVFLDSDATVRIGDGARIDGGNVLLGAHNQLDGSAVSLARANVSLGVADAAATSRFNVGASGDPGEALVVLGENAIVTGRDALSIEALSDQDGENLLSKAGATSFGAVLTGDAIAEANGTVQIRSTVTSGDGTVFSTGGLSVNADSTIGIDRVADSDAASFVTEFVRTARTVVRKITRWLPWPLNKVVEFITETVFVLVPKVTAVGSESAKSTGTGVQAKDTVDLNGDIYSVGNQDGLLTVHADPNDPNSIVVDPSSNISVELVDMDGNGTTDISVGNLVSSGSSANISITAAKGDIVGNARVHINKVIGEVHIVNETDKDLFIKHLDMVGSNDEDPDLNFQSENGQEYEVDSEISSSTLKIENFGTGDIVFTEALSNVTALLDVYNQGGNIRTATSEVYVETGDVGHLSLKTDGGSIGTAALPFNARLVRGKLLPDGSVSTMPAVLNADALLHIFLNVTGINNTFTEFEPTEIVDGIVLNLSSASGNIHVTSNAGVIIDTVTEQSTDENGQTVTTETQVSRASRAIYEFAQVMASIGCVTVVVHGDLDAAQISSPLGTVRLLATGSILHANNIFVEASSGADVSASAMVLTAGVAIGNPDSSLETQAGKLEASAANGIWVLNLGPLMLGGIEGGSALCSNGPIVVAATSPITVIANVISPADIVLSAGDSPGSGDDLTITNGAIVQSTGASVTLLAGDTFRLDLGSSVLAAGALNIRVDDGNADPATGGSVELFGVLTGFPVTIFGSSDDDTIAIAHVYVGTPLNIQAGDGSDVILVGSGGTLHTILSALTIDGGSGFDQLRIDDSAEIEDSIATLTGNTLTGLGLSAALHYSNIDSLQIDFGSGDDTVLVGNAAAPVVLNLHDGEDRVEIDDMANSVVIDFGKGNDRLTVSKNTAGSITAYGGDGNDHLEGGRGNDELFGGAGNDRIQGREGDDLLNGGDGNDNLSGGEGDDIILGDGGNDNLSGGQGRDLLIGGTGHDTLRGGSDGDILIGGSLIYDDPAALRAIRAEWSRHDLSEQERIKHLTCGGGLNGSTILSHAAVLDDKAKDNFRPSFCADWVIYSHSDKPVHHEHHPQHGHHIVVLFQPNRGHHDDHNDHHASPPHGHKPTPVHGAPAAKPAPPVKSNAPSERSNECSTESSKPRQNVQEKQEKVTQKAAPPAKPAPRK